MQEEMISTASLQHMIISQRYYNLLSFISTDIDEITIRIIFIVMIFDRSLKRTFVPITIITC